MSIRLIKSGLHIPQSVKVQMNEASVIFSGAYGDAVMRMPDSMEASVINERIFVLIKKDSSSMNNSNNIIGSIYAKIRGLLHDVDRGFVSKVSISGVGYRAHVVKSLLRLTLGYSHNIYVDIPKGIQISCNKNGTALDVTAADRELVGCYVSMLLSEKIINRYSMTGLIADSGSSCLVTKKLRTKK